MNSNQLAEVAKSTGITIEQIAVCRFAQMMNKNYADAKRFCKRFQR
ncbi:hypothetical protein [Ruminococcus albus]|nr:hypothetical protein [Ruminococcus albus]